MVKNFQNVEEIIADETFQAWYYRNNPIQVETWEKWIEANPQQSELVKQATEWMEELRLTESPVSAKQAAEAYKNLTLRLDVKEGAKIRSMTRSKWWLSAAAAVLLIASGIVFWKTSTPTPSLGTQYGEISTRQLPDGSTIMLNANSTAKLSESWEGDKDREVWLEGEAFFHVKKMPNKKRFIVHTNELDVIVTGTQFNVWTRDNKTSVLLTEGSVTIHTADGKETKMVPGDFVEINNSNLEKKKANQESILAWKDSRLIFDNTPMQEVARIIHEHYGVNVIITDRSLDSKPLNGILPNNNLDVLLQSLEATNDFRITRKDDEISISRP
jgi:transmembrane sensor